MLDIRFIRDNQDLVKEAIRKKRINFNLDELVDADTKRRELLAETETLRAEQNEYTEKIARAGEAEREGMIAQMREFKTKLQKKEEELETALKHWRRLMLLVPNIPDMSVPEGASDAENMEVNKWGEPMKFPFAPKSHVELMTELQMVDFDRGAKVSGFRGYFLKNAGAELSFALWQYGYRLFSKKGFTPVLAPSLLKQEAFYGTGYLPQGKEDLYRTQDDEYLAGTSEVPLMGYYMDEVLPKDSLPIKFLGFSPCYRREAGSHGKDTKGIMRVHEFFKFEQVILCEADHEQTVEFHEWMNRNTEEIIETLGIPYRTVINCAGDLGLGQVKKYDIELWVPSENTYREISSASFFHDFQTRRLNIRYRDDDGRLKFVHSLNATALPTPRLLIALVENNQEEDGSIRIPEALRQYMGGKEKITK